MSKTFYFNPKNPKTDSLPQTVLETRRRFSKRIFDTPVKNYPTIQGNEVNDLQKDIKTSSHPPVIEHDESKKATKQQIIEDAQKAIEKLTSPEKNEIKDDATTMITNKGETENESPITSIEKVVNEDKTHHDLQEENESLLELEDEIDYNQEIEKFLKQFPPLTSKTMGNANPPEEIQQGSSTKTSKSIDNDRILLLAVLIIVLKSPKRDWNLIIILLTLLMTD